MNVLQVVDAAPRTGQAQEDDPLAWIERASAQANTELYVLLQGDAVRYALTATQDASDADRGVTPIVRALYLAAALLAVVTVLVAGQVLARQAIAPVFKSTRSGIS